MKQKQSAKMPGQSIIYLLMCAALVLSFILAGLYPAQKSLGRLDMEIIKARDEIEEQKILFPVYTELVEKLRIKGSQVLPSPVRSKLSRDETEQIPAIFGRIARKCKLKAVSITPDAKSLADGSGLLAVNAFVKGRFPDFRKFLIELGGLPWLEHMERVDIQEALGGDELRVKIWLAIK